MMDFGLFCVFFSSFENIAKRTKGEGGRLALSCRNTSPYYVS